MPMLPDVNLFPTVLHPGYAIARNIEWSVLIVVGNAIKSKVSTQEDLMI